ncbi:hypothetical protein Tco_0794250 [Tanacetum coccineum]
MGSSNIMFSPIEELIFCWVAPCLHQRRYLRGNCAEVGKPRGLCRSPSKKSPILYVSREMSSINLFRGRERFNRDFSNVRTAMIGCEVLGSFCVKNLKVKILGGGEPIGAIVAFSILFGKDSILESGRSYCALSAFRSDMVKTGFFESDTTVPNMRIQVLGWNWGSITEKHLGSSGLDVRDMIFEQQGVDVSVLPLLAGRHRVFVTAVS